MQRCGFRLLAVHPDSWPFDAQAGGRGELKLMIAGQLPHPLPMFCLNEVIVNQLSSKHDVRIKVADAVARGAADLSQALSTQLKEAAAGGGAEGQRVVCE